MTKKDNVIRTFEDRRFEQIFAEERPAYKNGMTRMREKAWFRRHGIPPEKWASWDQLNVPYGSPVTWTLPEKEDDEHE